MALAAILAACSFAGQIDAVVETPTAPGVIATVTFISTGTTAATPSVQEPSALPTFTQATFALKRTATPIPSPTLTLTATPICNRALPGSPLDISIPDDAIMFPGQVFSKTWRLQNAGSCTWTSHYAVVFFSGDLLGAARTNPVPGPINPGQKIDLTVDMVAPSTSGTYQGNWELSDDQGNLFGLGPDGNGPFWVRIIVVAPDTETPTAVASPTLTPTPGIYVTGLANLVPGSTLDLDSNKTTSSGDDDLAYTYGDDKVHQLTPKNGARIVIFGQSIPSFSDCSTASLSTDPVTLDSIAQGTYFCYITNIGLPGWARLVALNVQDHSLTLEILTWTVP